MSSRTESSRTLSSPPSWPRPAVPTRRSLPLTPEVKSVGKGIRPWSREERRVNEADQGRIRLALGIERKRCRLGEADRAAYFEVRRRAAHLERTHRKRVGGQAELRRMLVFQCQTGKTHLEVVRSALELYPACSAERARQPELARGGY